MKEGKGRGKECNVTIHLNFPMVYICITKVSSQPYTYWACIRTRETTQTDMTFLLAYSFPTGFVMKATKVRHLEDLALSDYE